MTKSIVLAIASAAALVSFAPSASAANFNFSYNTAVVSSEKGATLVAKRLERSVKNACRNAGLRSLSAIASERRCETELMSDMVSKITNTRLKNALVGSVRIAQN